MIVYIYPTFRLNTKKNEDKEIKLKIKSSLLKIIIDFIHILTLTTEFNFHWPDIVIILFLIFVEIVKVSILLGALTKLLPTNTDSLSIDCFITLSHILQSSSLSNK